MPWTPRSSIGANRDYVREGYRAPVINRHAIYYAVITSAMRVARILHVLMDPDRHL